MNVGRLQFLGARQNAHQARRIVDEDRKVLRADANRRAAVLEREEGRHVRITFAEETRRFLHAASVIQCPEPLQHFDHNTMRRPSRYGAIAIIINRDQSQPAVKNNCRIRQEDAERAGCEGIEFRV